ncbi:MAG: hypothetical protein DRJ03_15610 [Chloroflexi bacterium]|nr:MAG: hypothetical protein B6I35_07190 [Anaerolineaceae bacterium 4572_32.2]RLC83952.1 MAG: hypothetical protein DRJ03_15610 [Chloroflexota bacterium]HEY72321.1 hypothetical protein [Thermoflexia bacterium]
MNWLLLIWVLICLAVALPLQVSIRRQVFLVSYLFTSNLERTLGLFGLLMLPGTLLHEGGHILAALLMGSRPSGLSLLPAYEDVGDGKGTIELGSVLVRDVGLLRNSIISIAPTIVGSALILLVGWLVFDFPEVGAAIQTGAWERALQCLLGPFETVWGWVGAYAILAISMNMLPSSADLQFGVGVFLLLVVLFVALALLYLAQSAALAPVVEGVNSILWWLGLVLTFTICLSAPVYVLLKLFASGGQVERG